MSISEFTLHNVLRTYSRQERMGQAQRVRPKGSAPPPTSDEVKLSPAGRKIHWLGQLAAEVVDRRTPGLPAEERTDRVRKIADELVARHREEVVDEGLGVDALEARLRPIYLS